MTTTKKGDTRVESTLDVDEAMVCSTLHQRRVSGEKLFFSKAKFK